MPTGAQPAVSARILFACQPGVMGRPPGIVYRTMATYLTRNAGQTKTMARTGAITLIRRFDGARIFIFTCCSLMVPAWAVQGHPQGFTGPKHCPAVNSIKPATPVPVVWPRIRSARGSGGQHHHLHQLDVDVGNRVQYGSGLAEEQAR